MDRAALHIKAVAFIHRFGSSLNWHVPLEVQWAECLRRWLAATGLPGTGH